MIFKEIQPKNSVIPEKIQGKKGKAYFRPKQTHKLELRGIALQPSAYGLSAYAERNGLKRRHSAANVILLRASGPPFLLSARPCALALSSLLKALKGRKKVSIPLSS